MAMEVLRPQDCLINQIRVPSFRRKTYGNSYYYTNNNYYNSNNFHVPSSGRAHRKPATRPKSRKWAAERKPSSDDSRVAKRTGLVMEKVTLLRRGVSLNSMIKSEELNREEDDLVLIGTQMLGPDPELKCNVYAGSACAVSPSPSALPFPSFSKKRPSLAVDDSATRDLRRLLRLE